MTRRDQPPPFTNDGKPVRVVPAPHLIAPDPEDFAAWAEHSVTRFVALAYERAALEAKRVWIVKSWQGGEANPDTLRDLRTTADCYRSFLEASLNDFIAMASKEPAK
jgi:hypothetical protein